MGGGTGGARDYHISTAHKVWLHYIKELAKHLAASLQVWCTCCKGAEINFTVDIMW